RLDQRVTLIVRVRPLQEAHERVILDGPPHPAAPTLDDRLCLGERPADEEERRHDDIRVPRLDGRGRFGTDRDEAVAVTYPLDRERVLDATDPTRHLHNGLQLSSGAGACRVAMS